MPVSEIASEANDYNLNIPRYIDSSEPEDIQDIDAHLRGGIPRRDVDALSRYWEVFPSLREQLFDAGDRPGYCRAKIPADQVRATVLRRPEFQDFSRKITGIFDEWWAAHKPMLSKIKSGSTPKEILYVISEDLLARFRQMPLLDGYDVYQRVLEYWDETMQDDVYLIAAEGWVGAGQPRLIVDDKDKKLKEVPDVTIGGSKYKMDLLPPGLLVARYFSDQESVVQQRAVEQVAAAAALEEFIEAHGGEEGLLDAARSDKDKVTKASARARLKAIAHEPESEEERSALHRCLELIEAEAEADRALRVAHVTLETNLFRQYARLEAVDVEDIVLRDKWCATLRSVIEAEVSRTFSALVQRVTELELRYSRPLAELQAQLEDKSQRVDVQLRNMGFVWC